MTTAFTTQRPHIISSHLKKNICHTTTYNHGCSGGVRLLQLQLPQQAMLTFSSSTSSTATNTIVEVEHTTNTSQTTTMTKKKQQPPRRRRRSRLQNQQQQQGSDDDDDDEIDRPGFFDMKAVPSLKDFMHRQSVLSMYRGFLRSVRYVGSKDGGNNNPMMADELRDEIRREFRAQKHETDPFQRQRAVADGQRRAAELRGLTGEPDDDDPTKKDAAVLQQEDADSWINIVDPEDQRGRVGSGWPWAK
eukprot:CAMPEP_0113467418 /NCGR_PEP_ID=MMETSP0014_2-20120614/14804_1 /TAXON_ID=2857 /ORGANISM="Nitzschia sp." /LENGTH=246 /DNA_ID=CAMNT_0000359725 /DNA_START=185 /DNA_END=925 /DNA_ORIENTATION=- /assembly_acc=CAM_ASM_000159